MDFEPVQIEIGTEYATSAAGDWLPYTYVDLIAHVGDWRCSRRIVSGEHWEPSVERAVLAAQERYGIATSRLFDTREDA